MSSVLAWLLHRAGIGSQTIDSQGNKNINTNDNDNNSHSDRGRGKTWGLVIIGGVTLLVNILYF